MTDEHPVDCPGDDGAVLLLRRALAASLSDAQLVLPRALIVAVIDGTVAELEALGIDVTERP